MICLMSTVALSQIVIPALANIYVFNSPDNYQMYRSSDELTDPALGIAFPLHAVFE